MNFIINFDIELLRWIQNGRITLFDDFLYWVSYTTTFVSIAILLILAYSGFIKKEKGLKTTFYQLTAIFSTSACVSLLLKYTVERPRPFVSYPDIIQLSEAGSYSFPSGHTTEAFTMVFGAILLFQNRFWAIPIGLWAILVAYSRMALGVHYPMDILSAMIIALLICLSLKTLIKKWRLKTK